MVLQTSLDDSPKTRKCFKKKPLFDLKKHKKGGF